MIEIKGNYTSATVMIDELEDTARQQIETFVNHPSMTNPVVIMPDTHAGKGAVIGFTMPMAEGVSPNVVGVDIACGMISECYDLKHLQDSFSMGGAKLLDSRIRVGIPMGFNTHKRNIYHMANDFPWPELNNKVREFTERFRSRFGISVKQPTMDADYLKDLVKRVSADMTNVINSIGTLGGGNHFIELSTDSENYTWATVHSGSRNLGLKIANYWQEVACGGKEKEALLKKEKIVAIKRNFPKDQWQKRIEMLGPQKTKPSGLECLYDENLYNYMVDSIFAYFYAFESRRIMLKHVRECLGNPEIISRTHTVHNYINHDDFIIRKGAVASYNGELMIIPFNMEDGILICEGRSNPEWNYSAPHGAGRVYSRKAAKEKLDVRKAATRMSDKGIFSSVIPVDEQRDAYKPASVIEAAIGETAVIVNRLRPIMNLKAA